MFAQIYEYFLNQITLTRKFLMKLNILRKKIKFKQIYIYKLLTKFLKYLDIVFKHLLIQIIKLLITIFYQ